MCVHTCVEAQSLYQFLACALPCTFTLGRSLTPQVRQLVCGFLVSSSQAWGLLTGLQAPVTVSGPHTCMVSALPTELSLWSQLCTVVIFCIYMKVNDGTSFYLVSKVQPKL